MTTPTDFERELRDRLHDSASRVEASDDLTDRAEGLHQRHVRRMRVGGALGAAAVLALGLSVGPWLMDRLDPSPAPIIGERETPSETGSADPDAKVQVPPLLDTWSILDEIGVPEDTTTLPNRVAYRAETAGDGAVFIERYDELDQRVYAVSLASTEGITDLITVGAGETIAMHGSIQLDGTWHAIVSTSGPDRAEAFLVGTDGVRAPRTLSVQGPDVRWHDVSPMLIGDDPDAMTLQLMPTYARGDEPLAVQPSATSESSTELDPSASLCDGCVVVALTGWDRHVAFIEQDVEGTQTLKLVDALTGDVRADHPFATNAQGLPLRIVGGPDGFLLNEVVRRHYLDLETGALTLLEPMQGGMTTFAQEPPGDGPAPDVEAPTPSPGWAPVASPPVPFGANGWGQAVWTGSEAILTGGGPSGDGFGTIQAAAYDPAADTWRDIEAPDTFVPVDAQLLWTGREAVLLGGDAAARTEDHSTGLPVFGWAYEPGRETWRRIPTAPLADRWGYTATWTGEELVVWGGFSPPGSTGGGTTRIDTYADGAAWDPDTNTWRAIAPSPLAPRGLHGAVWNGRRLVVFGGGSTEQYESEFYVAEPLDDAATYDPASDTWSAIASPGPIGPLVAYDWTGERIVHWSGELSALETDSWRTVVGAVWDPVTADREPLPPLEFLRNRRDGSVDSAWVDGLGWIVFGGDCGEGCNSTSRDGAVYDPSAGTWTHLVPPPGKVGYGATAVWLGDRLMTFGGAAEDGNHSEAGRVDTTALTWTPPSG